MPAAVPLHFPLAPISVVVTERAKTVRGGTDIADTSVPTSRNAGPSSIPLRNTNISALITLTSDKLDRMGSGETLSSAGSRYQVLDGPLCLVETAGGLGLANAPVRQAKDAERTGVEISPLENATARKPPALWLDSFPFHSPHTISFVVFRHKRVSQSWFEPV